MLEIVLFVVLPLFIFIAVVGACTLFAAYDDFTSSNPRDE